MSILLILAALSSSALAQNKINVSHIEISGLHSILEDELIYLIGIEEGAELSESGLSTGIRTAFKKGIFEDIEISSDDTDSGKIIIKVEEKDVIESIVVTGNEQVPDKFITKASGLIKGQYMNYSKIIEIEENVSQALRKKGFPGSSASLSVVSGGDENMITVVMEVSEGAPLIIENISVTGIDSKYLMRFIRLKPGDIYDIYKLQEDLSRLKQRLSDLNYLDPDVSMFEFEGGELSVHVQPGKRLTIKIEGNDSLSDKKILSALPYKESKDINDDLTDEAVYRILEMYRENGYVSAQTATVSGGTEQDVVLTFYISEGMKVAVSKIDFSGINISDKVLNSIMRQKKSEVYNPLQLTDDIERIKEFYIALGYIDVVVDPPYVSIEDSTANILINVTEGRRVMVSDIVVHWADNQPLEEILESLNIKTGDPYNEVDIAESRRNLIANCRNIGYLDCVVEVASKIENENASINYTIKTGRQYYFGKVIISGNTKVKLPVIKRELVHVDGMPYDASLLANEKKKLYKLNLFTAVDIKPFDPYGDKVDVNISVKEAKPGTIEFGLGYGEYEKFRGFIDLSYRNINGMHRKASLRTEQSSIASRYIANFEEPWLFGANIQSRTFALYETRTEKNIDTGEIRYRIDRKSISTGVEKKLADVYKTGLFYEFSLVETSDVKSDVVLSREDTGTLAISSITPSIVIDTRDSPFDPQRGLYGGASLKAAAATIGSETDFIKATAFASTYLKIIRPVVIAVSLRGGAAEGLRDTQELPLVERFFLGGRNTVRGFDQDELGPIGANGTPTGGNAFLVGNLEFRTTVAGGWRLITFADAGNVWISVNDTSPFDLRYTAGAGLQYNTPAGPIRLDYGWKIKPRPEESKSELHFSIGHAF